MTGKDRVTRNHGVIWGIAKQPLEGNIMRNLTSWCPIKIIPLNLQDKLWFVSIWSLASAREQFGYIIHVKTPYSRPAALLVVNIYLLLFACG